MGFITGFHHLGPNMLGYCNFNQASYMSLQVITHQNWGWCWDECIRVDSLNIFCKERWHRGQLIGLNTGDHGIFLKGLDTFPGFHLCCRWFFFWEDSTTQPPIQPIIESQISEFGQCSFGVWSEMNDLTPKRVCPWYSLGHAQSLVHNGNIFNEIKCFNQKIASLVILGGNDLEPGRMYLHIKWGADQNPRNSQISQGR